VVINLLGAKASIQINCLRFYSLKALTASGRLLFF
jgi:hypothetical protein